MFAFFSAPSVFFFFSLQQQPALHSFPQGARSQHLTSAHAMHLLLPAPGLSLLPYFTLISNSTPCQESHPRLCFRGSGLDSMNPLGLTQTVGIFLSFGGWRVQNQVPEDLGFAEFSACLLDGYLLAVSSHGLSLVPGWKDLSLPLLIRSTLSGRPYLRPQYFFRLHLNLINS